MAARWAWAYTLESVYPGMMYRSRTASGATAWSSPSTTIPADQAIPLKVSSQKWDTMPLVPMATNDSAQ